jgi:hypothetical protein
MSDLLVAMLFMAMVLSPCFVASGTGLHRGSDRNERDPETLEDFECRRIPC